MSGYEVQKRFRGHLFEIPELLDITIGAVSSLEARITLLEARKNVSLGIPELNTPGNTPEEIDDHIARVRERLPFAQKEINQGFPLLHSQAMVLLWSALEVYIEDICVHLLIDVPDLLGRSDFGRAKIDLVLLMQLGDVDRMRFIVNSIANRDPAPDPIARLERQLAIVGIDPFPSGDTRRDLLEFAHVRNLILHRDAVADFHFLRACPWMGISSGERVPVNLESFSRYYQAVCAFAAHVNRPAIQILRDHGVVGAVPYTPANQTEDAPESPEMRAIPLNDS